MNPQQNDLAYSIFSLEMLKINFIHYGSFTRTSFGNQDFPPPHLHIWVVQCVEFELLMVLQNGSTHSPSKLK